MIVNKNDTKFYLILIRSDARLKDIAGHLGAIRIKTFCTNIPSKHYILKNIRINIALKIYFFTSVV